MGKSGVGAALCQPMIGNKQSKFALGSRSHPQLVQPTMFAARDGWQVDGYGQEVALVAICGALADDRQQTARPTIRPGRAMVDGLALAPRTLAVLRPMAGGGWGWDFRCFQIGRSFLTFPDEQSEPTAAHALPGE